MQPRLEVNRIDVRYGDKKIVHNLSFTLTEGGIGCLLGPSGCGKTTVLRAIAGFEPLSSGNITVAGHRISDAKYHLPPEQRQIGMVFQDFALFPNMTVSGNICFALKGWRRKEQQLRISQLLDMIGMRDLAKAYPHQLSGGQQQRVALARAMAPRPSMLLLDEPFSSLDVELREQLAQEVRNILRQENITAILVTHDQQEAFAMADEICVMDKGRIQQQDSAYNLYHKPANRFVAGFIGEGVLIPGVVESPGSVTTELGAIQGMVPKGCKPGCKVDVLIRPDDIVHDDAAGESAVVSERAFRGSEFLYTLRMPSGIKVLCLAPSHHKHSIGETIGIRLEFDHLVVFPQEQAASSTEDSSICQSFS
ncbi:ABC transporter ATP-binding protein [Thiolapillus sp.]